MVQKLLHGLMVFTVFHVSCLSIHLVFESEFASGIKDVTSWTLPNENVIFDQHEQLYVENGRSL